MPKSVCFPWWKSSALRTNVQNTLNSCTRTKTNTNNYTQQKIPNMNNMGQSSFTQSPKVQPNVISNFSMNSNSCTYRMNGVSTNSINNNNNNNNNNNGFVGGNGQNLNNLHQPFENTNTNVLRFNSDSSNVNKNVKYYLHCIFNMNFFFSLILSPLFLSLLLCGP